MVVKKTLQTGREFPFGSGTYCVRFQDICKTGLPLLRELAREGFAVGRLARGGVLRRGVLRRARLRRRELRLPGERAVE